MDPHTNVAIVFPVDTVNTSLVRLSNMMDRIRRYGQRAMPMSGLHVHLGWCRRIFSQVYGRMREFVQGGMEYHTTLRKVQELESQLQTLLQEKEALEKAATLKLSTEPQAKKLKCSRCQGDMGDNFHPQQESDRQGTALPLSCPAPPPPPPPPPPPVPQVRINFRVVRKSDLQTKDSLRENTRDCRPLITAEDLQRVKLRRPEERPLTLHGEVLSSKGRPPTACGGELRRAVLRKTQSAVVLRDVGNMIPIHADDVAKQKQVLKKTTLKRSPGGTPLRDCKRRRESGQGLTPMMNKALRLRFQAQSPCLSSESDSSPVSSPDSGAQSITSSVNMSTSTLTQSP